MFNVAKEKRKWNAAAPTKFVFNNIAEKTLDKLHTM